MNLYVFLYSFLTTVPTGAFVNSLQLRAVMVIKSLPELSPEGSGLLLPEVAKPSVPIPALRNFQALNGITHGDPTPLTTGYFMPQK